MFTSRVWRTLHASVLTRSGHLPFVHLGDGLRPDTVLLSSHRLHDRRPALAALRVDNVPRTSSSSFPPPQRGGNRREGAYAALPLRMSVAAPPLFYPDYLLCRSTSFRVKLSSDALARVRMK